MGRFLGLFKWVGLMEQDEEEGEVVGELVREGKCMVMLVISLFTLRGVSSSPEDSESVALWSVKMTRRSFLLLGLVFVVVLHDGSGSKFDLEGFCFEF